MILGFVHGHCSLKGTPHTSLSQIDLVRHAQPFTFDPNDDASVYIWQYEGSKSKMKFMSFGLIALSAGLCMMKIWPLWLKILVYWSSLTLLVTLVSLMAIRLVLYSVMWIVGFRGVWLFPNLMRDDIGFTEIFRPVWGTGDEKEDKKGGLTWDFGLINLLVLFGFGALFCYYIGMFDSKQIPDFVVNQQELFRQYPSLAPPVEDLTETVQSEPVQPDVDASSFD